MITGRTIGRNGRLGNQLFQVAFLLAQSKRHGVKIGWHNWQYAKYFKGDFKPSIIPIARTEHELAFHYTPEHYDALDWGNDIDFHGYFQSYKYWQGCEDEIRASFEFVQPVTERVRAMNAAILEKPTIAIHLRRGDYAGNPEYANLSANYYLSALEKHFPDWRQQNLVVFSDDVNYAKLHFGCFDNAHFPNGSEIDDLCLMTLCSSLIIANSSFSWWGAYLSGSKKVVRPERHFEGKLAGHDISDLYPSEWIKHDAERLDLRDTTFLIPVSLDHPDRLANLELILQTLICQFDTNFIVCEQGGEHFKSVGQFCEYLRIDSATFHRTRMLNIMAEMANTPYVVNYDADVLLSPSQILESVARLRNGADVVYPYAGRFVRLPRNVWYRRLMHSLDIGETAGHNFAVLRRGDTDSKGGCVFFNRESFFAGGGENENFVSFGHEDEERFYRFAKLGYDVQRVNGNIYHMEHYCGVNSSTKNPAYVNNVKEWERVKKMDAEQLRAYIASFAIPEKCLSL